jgi:membrane protease YdiL (CAAX protease family)
MTSWPIDHLLAFILVVVAPLLAHHDYRKFVRRVRDGIPGARLREYRITLFVQWGLAAVLAGWWALAGRSWAALGITVPGGFRLLLGAGTALIVVAFFGLQWWTLVRLDEAGRESLRARVGSVGDLLPRTPPEARWFNALSLTAAICEETAYRGFLIWYFARITGAWPAVVLVSVAFGIGHFYQGRAAILKTGLVGAFLGALYLLGGSLLWPAVIHAVVDLQGGAMGRILVQEPEAVPPAS